MRQLDYDDPLLVWRLVTTFAAIFWVIHTLASPLPLRFPDWTLSEGGRTRVQDPTGKESVKVGLTVFQHKLHDIVPSVTGQEQLVMVLGNSLLRNAVNDPVQLGETLSQESGERVSPPIRVELAMGPWLYLHHIEPWFDDIVAKNPRAIVLQGDILFDDPNHDPRRQVADGILRWEERTPPQPLEQRTPLDYANAARLWSGKVLGKDENWQAGTHLIDLCLTHQIPLVIVDLPPSKTALKFATSAYFGERRRNLAQLELPGRVTLLSMGNVAPDEYFTDFNHFNLAGSQVFHQWFVPRFKDLLGGN